MSAFIDITGEIYGRLTVLKKAEMLLHGRVSWHCKCVCGKHVVATGNSLRVGNTLSCGCLRIEATTRNSTTHGNSRKNRITPLYRKWKRMRQRCYDKNCKDYAYYGGRGIKICDEWLKSYKKFRDYVLSLPGCPNNAQVPGAYLDKEIDRYPNNDGDYEPGNIRWATRKEQMNNTRSNHMIPVNGVLIAFQEAVRLYGKAPERVILERINRYKWPLKRAFLTPVRGKQ